MKNSKALIEIAKKFRNGECKYGICNEICMMSKAELISHYQLYEMKRRIYELLGNAFWLETWLRKNVEDYDPIDKKKLSETRAQWCEHMAKYWKRKGN